jgi:hypothetical protein
MPHVTVEELFEIKEKIKMESIIVKGGDHQVSN